MRRFSTGGIPSGWQQVLSDFLAGTEGRQLMTILAGRLDAGAVIYPPDPWRALRLTDPASVRAVILGQDPYYGPGQACGLAFSVPDGTEKLPPSLRNIFTELSLEYGKAPASGNLSGWAEKGVLLLNTVLTVEKGKAFSCSGFGWEKLTDRLIAHVAAQPGPRVFMLWGAAAQKKEPLIRNAAAGEILVLKANHPSPLSARRPPVPFIGCGHFVTANAWLEDHGSPPLDWV